MKQNWSRRELEAFGEPLGDSVTQRKLGGGYICGGGGKGVVIIRYLGAQSAGGGSYSSSGGNSIHTFTGDGTFRSNLAIYSIN